MQLERLRAERAELENKLTSAVEEREMKESEIGIITMAIEQLYQRAQQSCRDDRRRNAMLEYTESKFGHREDLVLACVSEPRGPDVDGGGGQEGDESSAGQCAGFRRHQPAALHAKVRHGT